MRQKLVEADLVECVLGLGPNLFYNSAMEACVVICASQKLANRKGKILFIDAHDHVRREKTMSYLLPQHQERIFAAFQSFENIDSFSYVGNKNELENNAFSLSIANYVQRTNSVEQNDEALSLALQWKQWERNAGEFWEKMESLTLKIDKLLEESS